MAKKKKKYYVVWEGNNPGIYDTWPECQLQIKGYPNAKYKSFATQNEAVEAFRGNYADAITPRQGKPKTKIISATARQNIIWDSLSVDAACSGSPGIMEYRGVWTQDAVQIFHQGPFPLGTNNVGEFLALVHGISWLQKMGKPELPIYSDSRTALAWLRNKKVKTTLVRNSKTSKLYDLVERAENWVKNNTWKNPVLKWDTENWGEIPADFGRK